MSGPVKTTITPDRAIHRADGSVVLCCESGNLRLGVVLTPEPAGVIIGVPEGAPCLDLVAVRMGQRHCALLAELASHAAAAPGDHDATVSDEMVAALERRLQRAYDARRGTVFDREHGWGWCVGCGRNPVSAEDGIDTCPAGLANC
jgi:hypothetical protein